MKIDLKKLIKKILDHRKDPKIFVAVFTILLSCISFGYGTQIPCYSTFTAQGDFTCVDSYGTLGQVMFFDANYQTIFNGDINTNFLSFCFPTVNGNSYAFGCSSNSLEVSFYSLGSSQPAEFNLKFIDNSNNTSNSMNFYISPGDSADFDIIYDNSVNLSSSSNSVSFSSAVGCSSCESSLSSCQSDYGQCYRTLQSLQSDYEYYYSGYNSCNSSLSSCQSDLNYVSGYVSSLESELNQCTSDLINCSNSSNTGSCETGSNWSALYINDIQHLGKPNIFITIPEEINWSYTSEGDDFDLNVSGYNVDTEYIENVIDIQNTKPSKDDFNKIVSEVIPLFVPGLIIILFIYFVFRFVKKVF